MATALITGATSGLGKALAERYAEAGWQVILVGRREDKFPVLRGPGHTYIVGDLRCPDVVEQIVQAADRSGVNVLVNCAATRHGLSFMQSLSSDMVEEIELNLLAPMLLTHRLWMIFARQGAGTIINIGSLAASSPGPNEAAYAASKGGLQAFSKALQFEATEIGVRVLYVELGAMNSPMTSGRMDQMKLIHPADAANTLFSLSTQPDTLRVTEISINRSIY